MNHNVENDQMNSTEQTSATPPYNKKKKVLGIIVVIVAIIVVFSVIDQLGPNKEESAAVKEQKIQIEIFDILDSTKVNSNFYPTIGNMVVTVLRNYKITYDPVENSETLYRVKISGDYSPNPDYPYLSYTGYIIYTVDIEKRTCKVYSDPNNLEGIFLVYIVH